MLKSRNCSNKKINFLFVCFMFIALFSLVFSFAFVNKPLVKVQAFDTQIFHSSNVNRALIEGKEGDFVVVNEFNYFEGNSFFIQIEFINEELGTAYKNGGITVSYSLDGTTYYAEKEIPSEFYVTEVNEKDPLTVYYKIDYNGETTEGQTELIVHSAVSSDVINCSIQEVRIISGTKLGDVVVEGSIDFNGNIVSRENIVWGWSDSEMMPTETGQQTLSYSVSGEFNFEGTYETTVYVLSNTCLNELQYTVGNDMETTYLLSNLSGSTISHQIGGGDNLNIMIQPSETYNATIEFYDSAMGQYVPNLNINSAGNYQIKVRIGVKMTSGDDVNTYYYYTEFTYELIGEEIVDKITSDQMGVGTFDGVFTEVTPIVKIDPNSILTGNLIQATVYVKETGVEVFGTWTFVDKENQPVNEQGVYQANFQPNEFDKYDSLTVDVNVLFQNCTLNFSGNLTVEGQVVVGTRLGDLTITVNGGEQLDGYDVLTVQETGEKLKGMWVFSEPDTICDVVGAQNYSVVFQFNDSSQIKIDDYNASLIPTEMMINVVEASAGGDDEFRINDVNANYDGESHALQYNLGSGMTIGFYVPEIGEKIPEEELPKLNYNLTTAPSYVNAGSYIVLYKLTTSDKTTYGQAMINIERKQVSAAVESKIIQSGQAKPETYTVKYGEFVNGDTESVVKNITFDVEYTGTAGVYPITCNIEADNYKFDVTAGYLIAYEGNLQTVSGNILNQSNVGISGVTVSLEYNRSVIKSVTTDSVGAYTITDVPCLEYIIRATYNNASTFSAVAVMENEVLQLSTDMKLSEDIYLDYNISVSDEQFTIGISDVDNLAFDAELADKSGATVTIDVLEESENSEILAVFEQNGYTALKYVRFGVSVEFNYMQETLSMWNAPFALLTFIDVFNLDMQSVNFVVYFNDGNSVMEVSKDASGDAVYYSISNGMLMLYSTKSGVVAFAYGNASSGDDDEFIVELASINVQYDGQQHLITNATEYLITFSSDEDIANDGDIDVSERTFSLSQSPAYVNAGTYPVYYRAQDSTDVSKIYFGTSYITITKVALTITANNVSVVINQNIPSFTVSYSGFVSGDDESCLLGTLSFDTDYENGMGAGNYTITPSGLSSQNYTIEFINGTLTVTSAESVKVSVSGRAIDDTSLPLLDATVQLKQGNNLIADTTTNAMGEFSFTEVLSGNYIVNVIKSAKCSSMVGLTVGTEDVIMNDIVLSSKDIVLKLELDTTNTNVLSGFNTLYNDSAVIDSEKQSILDAGGSAELSLNVASSNSENVDANKIVTFASQNNVTVGQFFEIKIGLKMSNADDVVSNYDITETTNVLIFAIKLDNAIVGKNNIKLYRYHNGVVEVLTTTANNGEKFELSADGKYVTIYSKNFSMYAIGFEDDGLSFGALSQTQKIIIWSIFGALMLGMLLTTVITNAVVKKKSGYGNKNFKSKKIQPKTFNNNQNGGNGADNLQNMPADTFMGQPNMQPQQNNMQQSGFISGANLNQNFNAGINQGGMQPNNMLPNGMMPQNNFGIRKPMGAMTPQQMANNMVQPNMGALNPQMQNGNGQNININPNMQNGGMPNQNGNNNGQ